MTKARPISFVHARMHVQIWSTKWRFIMYVYVLLIQYKSQRDPSLHACMYWFLHIRARVAFDLKAICLSSYIYTSNLKSKCVRKHVPEVHPPLHILILLITQSKIKQIKVHCTVIILANPYGFPPKAKTTDRSVPTFCKNLARHQLPRPQIDPCSRMKFR